MKTLFLLRHAKSSWADSSLTDFERPLNSRGLHAAPRIGQYLRENRLVPQLVVSSPARRARDTALLAVEAARVETSVRYDANIYEADVAQLLRVVGELPDEFERVLLVGHNPGFSGLLDALTNVPEYMPTAALAALTLKINTWQEACAGCGRLTLFVKPKELKD